MRRLWQLLDEVPPPAPRSGVAVIAGIAASALGALATIVSGPLLGIQLPFLCGIAVVMILTTTVGMAAALASCTGNLLAFVLMMRLRTMPFLTWRNILVVECFCICMAIIGGLLRRKQEEQKAFAVRLAQREEHLQSIFDYLPAAIVIVDTDGQICAINAGGCALFETTPEAALTQRLDAFVEIEQTCQRDIGTVLADLAPNADDESVNAIGMTTTGKRRTLRLSTAYVPSGKGRWLTVYLRDQTETLATAAKLEEVQHQLMQVTRVTALGEMGSTIAHELNQPLTAVCNLLGVAEAELARAEIRRERVAEAIAASLSQTLRAGEVLKRLRNFVSRGAVPRQILQVRDIASEAVALSQFAVRDAGLRLCLDIQDGLPPLYADPVQTQQVLVNMIRNAIEVLAGTPDGLITIEARAFAATEIRIAVVDNGPGLSAAVATRLFTPFATTKEDGLGLGLSISKSIVEAHGGCIGCEADAGGGARFWFTLPLADIEGARIAA